MVKEFKELGINYLKEIKSIRSFRNQAIGKFSNLNEKTTRVSITTDVSYQRINKNVKQYGKTNIFDFRTYYKPRQTNTMCY